MDWTPEKIKALRKRLGLNQTEMATALGYTRKQSVSDLERGEMVASGPVLQLLEHLDVRGQLPETGK